MERRETPVKTRESSVGLVGRPLGDRVRGIHIPAQPLGHMGVPKIVREQVLEDTVGGKARDVLERFKSTPEDRPFLKDKEFQDWLEQMHVLQRYPQDSVVMPALRNRVERIGKKKRIPQREQLFLMLMSEEGYFISPDRLNRALKSNRGSGEISFAVGRVYLPQVKFRLQQQLEQELSGLITWGKDISFDTPSVGMGIGIKSFNLDHHEMSLLYQLYSNPGDWVSSAVLNSVLESKNSSSKEVTDEFSNLHVPVYIHRLRKKATELGYLFEIQTNPGLGYRLVPKTSLIEDFKVTPEQPFLDKKFQDWLVEKGALQRYPQDSVVMPALRNRVERIRMQGRIPQYEQLFLMLMSEEGYFISPDRLNRALKSNRRAGEDLDGEVVNPSKRSYYLEWLRNRLKGELGNLIPGDNLLCITSVGAAIGIKSFGLSRQEMLVLYQLYSNPGDWVSSAVLNSVLESKNDGVKETTNSFIKVLMTVKRLRERILSKGYSFEIQTNPGSGYRLIEKTSIVEQFQDTPEHQSFLKDKEFQDWLVQMHVLQRYPKHLKVMQVLRNLAGEIGMKRRIPQYEQLFLMLMSEEGYFISPDRLNRALEGDRWSVDNQNGGGAVDLPVQRFRLQKRLRGELGSLMTEDIPSNARTIGMGIGIRGFGLGYQDMSLLYNLYSNLGEWVPEEELASVLPHRRAGVADELNVFRVALSRLRKKAVERRYLFDIQPGSGGYKLIEKQLIEGTSK